MKTIKLPAVVSRLVSRPTLLLKKHSPTILVVAGVTGIVGATVLACKATLQVKEVLDDKKQQLRDIKEIYSDSAFASDEDQKEGKRLITMTHVHSGLKLVKLYGPAVALGLGSVACILSAHGIMQKRNVALMAAYKAVDEGFNKYRQRVVEELGEEKDYGFKHGMKQEEITVEEVNEETGKTKKVKKTVNVMDPSNISQYARFFDESSKYWQRSAEYNLLHLRSQQNYMNDLLRINGHVFLNEVYDGLGIPRTKEGSVVGWRISKDGDNFIDFGIFNVDNPKVRDFVNGYEQSILLDFNVDGVIYDLI